MLILCCPNCGERNVSEFRFGGEYNPRPSDPYACDDAELAAYLYLSDNKLGVETAWWYHQAGCGLWFLAQRHTKTQDVLKTYAWQADAVREGRDDD